MLSINLNLQITFYLTLQINISAPSWSVRLLTVNSFGWKLVCIVENWPCHVFSQRGLFALSTSVKPLLWVYIYIFNLKLASCTGDFSSCVMWPWACVWELWNLFSSALSTYGQSWEGKFLYFFLSGVLASPGCNQRVLFCSWMPRHK